MFTFYRLVMKMMMPKEIEDNDGCRHSRMMVGEGRVV
jgi:hypothetical protein